MAEPSGREIIRVRRGGAAARLGVRKGDHLTAVNGKRILDVLDVQFHSADGIQSLSWERKGRVHCVQYPQPLYTPLGLEFQHPTFDTNIRRCNNRCRFCFVVQMAPGMRRTLHIKDDDYRYSFLYGHFVTLTNLREADWRKIAEQRLSPLYVSVQATEPDVRIAMMGNPRAGDILDRLRFLQSAGIVVHAQVVLAPGWNDGPHLRRTVEDLASFFPAVRSCTVVPVGLTRFHRHGMRVFTIEEKRSVLQDVGGWQEQNLRTFGSRFVFLTDEWYLSCGLPVPPLSDYEDLDMRENGLGLARNFLEEWSGFQRRVRASALHIRRKEALLLTGKLFEPMLKQAAAQCDQITGSRLFVHAVTNQRFGETVTVAGLLTGKDILDALAAPSPLPGLVVLPRVMFDHPDALSLDDLTPLDIARGCERPVGLANSMEDVVRLMVGESQLIVKPTDRRIPQSFYQAGGWIEG
jgi:putative radical SAM enzyme (TIGR03279 family)